MHAATAGLRLPAWLPRTSHLRMAVSWRGLREAGVLDRLAAMPRVDRVRANAWLAEHADTMQAAAERLFALRPRRCLLHGDVRADNFRFHGGRLKLFDWAFVSSGPPEMDAAFLAQAISCDGVTDPEEVLAAYRRRGRLLDAVLDGAVAALAGVFASRAWRPRVPYAPGLRRHQRAQLRATLTWAARRLGLPPPAAFGRLPG